MKRNADSYWYFSRTERRGALALGVLCMVLFMAPSFFDRLISPDSIDASGFKRAIEVFATDTLQVQAPTASPFYFNPNKLSKDSFVLLGLPERTAAAIVRYRQKGGYFKLPEDFRKIYNLTTADYQRLAPYIQLHRQQAIAHHTEGDKKTVRQLFSFDPNKVTLQDLERLGIPMWVTKIWLNYLSKGGHFYTKEDLLKLYGMDAALYRQLEPYIEIVAITRQATYKKSDKALVQPVSQPVAIPVNRADQSLWESLPGIGPALAQRIVYFREKLGGFARIEQVAETRGLPDSVFQNIKNQLVAEPVFRFIAINTADETSLKAHPYISPQEARALVNYRLQHGPFEDVRHLARIKLWKPERLEKVLPYLQLN